MADEAAHLGPSTPSLSYLDIDRILQIAKKHRVDAIHPGYGFLSENPEFAAACEDAGFTFIGPSAKTIRAMGSKTQARNLARDAGVPVLAGTDEGVADAAEAREIAERVGYPVLIKADAGGGGKGMRRVDSPGELHAALRDASSEAERSFRSGSVYIEKYLENPRHIEIQVLGDRHGNLIHLGERECSIQRRHQKIIEETPSPLFAKYPDLRPRMGEAALRVAKAAGYFNAGTVEFLVGSYGNFYFLEMNTRLQVEHPVTELVTGLDLVQWQVRVAAGQMLPFAQDDINWRGAAIECRLYAEDPEQSFFPSPGEITSLTLPSGPGIRIDSGVYRRWTVPMEYDPLLAKLTAWSENREQAVERLLRALSETHVGGIATNVSFLAQIIDSEEFRAGEIHTGVVEQRLMARTDGARCPDRELVAGLVAAARESALRPPKPQTTYVSSKWLIEGRARMLG
jgi:acetyl-CoA carboxylase biotin carboxylase subunit